MALFKKNLKEIVSELSKGRSEQKLNQYYSEGYSINTIKDSLLILQKSEKPVPIEFSKLDRELDIRLTSDIPFLLKLIEINPYIFSIAQRVLKDNIFFVLLALKRAQDPKIIYEKLNDELKEDPDVLDLVFPKSKNAYASRLTNNRSIQQARRLDPELNSNLFAPKAHFELVNPGKKLSPERSSKSRSPKRSQSHSQKRSAKNLGGGIKKSKKRKTKKT